jgi:hypothetical protein
MKIKLNAIENMIFKGKKVTDSKLPKITKGEWRITQVLDYLVVTKKDTNNAYIETDQGWYMIKLW